MRKSTLLFIISLLEIMILTSCRNQTFDGSRTSNDKQFILSYSVLSKTISHEMDLVKGTKVDINIEDKAGRVDILITNNNNLDINKDVSASSGDYVLEIPESDTYKFFVTGNKAKGGISFKVVE